MTISRRDFLKLSGLLTASTIVQPGLKMLPAKYSANPDAKNVLIFLFDALSALNVNFYGYPRETMPYLTKLLDRATVYHNHYASSHFTTTGTTSLLTGRHPWEHLALKHTEQVSPSLSRKNFFSFFQDYFTLTYTHNPFVEYILEPFSDHISQTTERHDLFLDYSFVDSSQWFTDLMSDDPDTAMLFKTRLTDTSMDGYLYSLLFPSLLGEDKFQFSPEILERFPIGIPEAVGSFLLEDAINWSLEQAISVKQPFLGYFHFFPPHSPYNTRIEFIDTFADDGYIPVPKPRHPVVIPSGFLQRESEHHFRKNYDEFLLYVDSEFNRLFNQLDQQGVLDNTIVVFTSDHGEMFERGTKEHLYPYLFDPVAKIPLIIFHPGQTERIDIHAPTSCIDLLPTLLHCTGHEVPSDLPGTILSPYSSSSEETSRPIYAMSARWNQNSEHIKTATLMMRRDNLKVIRYSGYADYYRENREKNLGIMKNGSEIYYEVFDLENDPEELDNLAASPIPEIQALIAELEDFYRESVEYPK